MGENEITEVKTPAAPVPASKEKIATAAEPEKTKKKDKKPAASADVTPHVTGRLLHVEVGAGALEFAIKGKKGKSEVFSLKGMDSAAIPAASALLASLVASKSKLRVEFAVTGESSRTVKRIRANG